MSRSDVVVRIERRIIAVTSIDSANDGKEYGPGTPEYEKAARRIKERIRNEQPQGVMNNE
ncbi:MAG: hypothetical protein JRN10_00205 [Nitrososphaerota archaeon]|nr:hypothetical protein [Nitrososphaerota archaeon]MDG6929659.1 hypothetical protein [Nitrososphaerota archaeon]